MAMRKLLLAAVALAALSVTANADTYTYMCRVGPKFYPVKATTPKDSLSGGTITWRGTVFKNVELGEGCKANFCGRA
jgi:hypothetical protein